jgi:hypothetical protein
MGIVGCEGIDRDVGCEESEGRHGACLKSVK